MKGTGFFLAALLLVVLVAVAYSAQQMEDMRAEEYRQLMQQRDEAVKLAQEAKAQRDQKASELALAQVRLADMQVGIQKREAEIRTVTAERDEAVKMANERRAQVAFLQEKNGELQQQVSTLLAQNKPLIPVTSGDASQLIPTSVPQYGTFKLPVQANASGMPVEAGLVALFGLAAVGGGGYAALHRGSRRRIG